jgi:hypothetical protein
MIIEFLHGRRKEWIRGRSDMTWSRAKEYGVPCREKDADGFVIREFHPFGYERIGDGMSTELLDKHLDQAVIPTGNRYAVVDVEKDPFPPGCGPEDFGGSDF